MAIHRPVGVLSLPGRVERAIAFAAQSDIYVAFGRTSPWGTQSDETGLDDLTPPIPDPRHRHLFEPLGYKKATARLVTPDPNGALRTYDTRWRVLDEAEARTLLSPYVYINASFDYDELPIDVEYRQLAVYSGLVPEGSVAPGQVALLPGEVQDPGILEYLYNDRPALRSINEVDVFDLVMTF